MIDNIGAGPMRILLFIFIYLLIHLLRIWCTKKMKLIIIPAGETLGPSQSTLDVHLIQFVVGSMLPLSIVDRTEFKALMACCLDGYSKRLQLPSRRKLGKMIFDHYKVVEKELKR